MLDEKCSAVRNRNSKCRLCIDACPGPGVITIMNNHFFLDFDKCVGCGACTTVCPNEALVSLDPMDADLAAQVVSGYLFQTENAPEPAEAVIACARIASKNLADPRTYAEVPCLCRVEESLLVSLAARGVNWITLVDGNCETCKYRSTQSVTDMVVDTANDLLELCDAPARVERVSEFPDVCQVRDERSLYASDRRGFFSLARQDAKEAALVAAKRALSIEDVKLPILERIRVEGGKMPQFAATRRNNTVDALDKLGAPLDAAALGTHLWGRVDIDIEKCNACNVCTVFCPTGALRKAADELYPELQLDPEHPDELTKPDLVLEFDAATCTNCGLCLDACFRHALTLTSEARPSELLDPEPRSFNLFKKPEKALFGAR